jgi:lysosomal acid lipase/cholesteryl ester hydrolase
MELTTNHWPLSLSLSLTLSLSLSLSLWQVLAFIIYAFGLILIERIARTLLSLLTFFIPHILVAAFQRRWHATIMPSLSNFRRTNSSQAVPNLSHEEAECQRELYYDACELIRRRGYPFEQHYAETPDGFLLGLHRIPHGRGEGDAACQQPGSPRPCVYLMHGFLQSSEAWLSMRQNLAFMLADAGFDVWLGNSRGNKYSCHHRTLNPHTDEYWSYCIDDVASKDVPTALTYILNLTSLPSISYIGFSQGTAVAFACFSTRPDIARKVNCFIALAPATQAKGFSQPLLDSVAKLSPDIVYLLLGRGSLFGNLFLFWQNLLTNAQLIRVIDFFVGVMFHWRSGERESRVAMGIE